MKHLKILDFANRTSLVWMFSPQSEAVYKIKFRSCCSLISALLKSVSSQLLLSLPSCCHSSWALWYWAIFDDQTYPRSLSTYNWRGLSLLHRAYVFLATSKPAYHQSAFLRTSLLLLSALADQYLFHRGPLVSLKWKYRIFYSLNDC